MKRAASQSWHLGGWLIANKCWWKNGTEMEAEKGREHDPETQIQSQQTNGEPMRRTGGGGEGREERNMKGWHTKHETQKDAAAAGITWAKWTSRLRRLMSFF